MVGILHKFIHIETKIMDKVGWGDCLNPFVIVICDILASCCLVPRIINSVLFIIKFKYVGIHSAVNVPHAALNP